MDTIVLKFGGSSVADNEKLKLVANKIIKYKADNYNVIAVVSAQGNTTDNLLKEAYELSDVPVDRELDVLLSTGEQITISKLSILLNSLGYESVSLTGYQAGIITNNINQNAVIKRIDTKRIFEELENNKIVIIAGFQGIDENLDITTLGRGGSDTTAVAVAAAINAKKCIIYSDVDGIYTADPNIINTSKKLANISYDEMQQISEEGAKVLHNRCVNIAKKYNLPIVAKSTFNKNDGTVINDTLEDNGVKGIVYNNKIIYVHVEYDDYSIYLFNTIYKSLIENGIYIDDMINNSLYHLDLKFTIKEEYVNKLKELIKNKLNFLKCTYCNVSKISIIGCGIKEDSFILKEIINTINKNNISTLKIDLSQSKIVILFKGIISNEFVKSLHDKIIEAN